MRKALGTPGSICRKTGRPLATREPGSQHSRWQLSARAPHDRRCMYIECRHTAENQRPAASAEEVRSKMATRRRKQQNVARRQSQTRQLICPATLWTHERVRSAYFRAAFKHGSAAERLVVATRIGLACIASPAFRLHLAAAPLSVVQTRAGSTGLRSAVTAIY